jgi:ABC-2 type transport system ATP-binding protein
MINFNHVSKVFKSDLLSQPFVALDDVSFEIPEGSMVGFLGANGAGKTTSLKIIMDFIRPSSGSVTFHSSLGTNRLEIFKAIGFLPERPYFYPSLSGKEFLHFMGKLSGLDSYQINNEVQKWSPRFKIDYALGRELKTYSKGMLQRIGFLATILHHPKIVILDEPLSGLDPIGRKELKDVILQLHKDGKTIFFSSHIVSDVEEICDRVIFLKQGRLVYDGPVGTLINDSQSFDYLITVKVLAGFIPKAKFKEMTSLHDNLCKYVVDPSVKDEFILEMIQHKNSIYSIEMKKPTLEEIFYKTRGKRDIE